MSYVLILLAGVARALEVPMEDLLDGREDG